MVRNVRYAAMRRKFMSCPLCPGAKYINLGPTKMFRPVPAFSKTSVRAMCCHPGDSLGFWMSQNIFSGYDFLQSYPSLYCLMLVLVIVSAVEQSNLPCTFEGKILSLIGSKYFIDQK